MFIRTRPVMFTLAHAVLLTLAGAGVLHAEAPAGDADTLQEIVVTAQNRVENVQKVPIAIDVVSAAKIAETGFASLNDIQKVAPAVQLINDNNELRVTIRGVGSNTNGETDDTSVVVNVDGEYINRGEVLSSSMFDIERMEVLRGPQGTLYGRNSTGGAINIITRKPGDEFAVNASAGHGNYGANNFEAGVDLPIGSIGGVRLSGIYNEHDGYYSHPANNGPALIATPATTSDSARNTAGRVSLRLHPTQALTIDAAVEYGNRHYVNAVADTVDLHAPGIAPTGPDCNAPGFVNIAPLWLTVSPTYVDPGSGTVGPYAACVPKDTNFLAGRDRKASYVQPWYGAGGYNQDSHPVRGRIEYVFSPAATLTYVGGYRKSGLTGDQGLPVIYHTITFKDDVTTQSHELRLNGDLGRVAYQTGVFHFDEKLDSDQGFAIDSLVFPPFLGGGPPGTSQTFITYFTRKQDSKSDSAFGQIDVGITDTLKAQVGVRYTKNKREAVYGNALAPLFGLGIGHQDLIALFGPASQSNLASDESKTTYLVGLNYTPDARTLIYGKVSTGFKGGGFDQVGTFKPETNTALEAGLKENFGASGQNYFNVSAFHYHYTDLQVSALLNPVVGAQTFNAGKATIYGLEFESGFRLTHDDSLTATLNYLHARFDEFLGVYDIYCPQVGCAASTTTDLDPHTPGVQQPNFAGNTPANSPKFVATLEYDHTFHLGNAGSVKASVFGRYKSSAYTDFYNYNDAQQKDYAQADISVEYKNASGHLFIQGYVQNVTDYRPLINAYYISAGPDRIFNFWYGEPRLFGVKLGVNY